jgi:cytochrome P450
MTGTLTLAERPPGHWLVGNYREFRRDPLAFLERCAALGDAVPLRLINRRAIVAYHPDLIEQVLVHRHRSFRKHFALRLARPVLGDGLLLSDGETWVRHRRLTQPAFRAERIAGYAPIMRDHVERMLDAWRPGTAFDLHDEMMRLTSGIVSACLFGADISSVAGEASALMERLVTAFVERLDAPWIPLFLPLPRIRRFWAALHRLEELLDGIISARRIPGAPAREDLLAALLRAHEAEGGTALDDRQLRDEMVTLFVAGHETTANALSWTFWLLASHPEAEARLHAELDAGPSDPEGIAALPWLRAVIDESMRLRPPAWIIGRESTEPCELGGIALPKGTTVLMSQWAVQRDARWFADPLAFKPERWLDGLAGRIPRFAYFPFGGGPRLCVGEHFARLELALLIAAIARRYRLRLVPGARVEPWPTITLRPRHGVAMTALARA